MTPELLLKLEDVAAGYDRQVVLQGINLEIMRRSFTGLLGANGSGKSTLIKTILGIIPPLAGRITFRPVQERPAVLSYVPQRESLDPIFLLSNFEVVLMGVCGRVGPGRGINQTERDWAHQCLQQVGAETVSRKRFSQLSGGQKQRVLIARALAAKPDFLALDEPVAGIDVAATQAIMELLRRIHEEQQMTILMVSHDLLMMQKYAHHVIWLHQGKILQGPANELLSRARIEEILDLQLH